MMTRPGLLKRRDLLLMSSGAAALCAARLTDGLLASAAVEGSPALQDAAARLQDIPATIGAWSSEPGRISDHEQHAASIHSYVRRDFTNSDSGHRVGMTLLCGPAGPMAVHPPTACFEGVGYTPLSGPVLTSVRRDASSSQTPAPKSAVVRDDFKKSTFRQDTSTVAQAVRVFWSWSTNGDWTAPERPRVQFRGLPWLYKLYITDQSVLRPGIPFIPQAESFLQDALPVLRQHLNGSVAAHRSALDSSPA